MKNLFKEPLHNPIPKFLEIIPYTNSAVDVVMLDKLLVELIRCGYSAITNSLVMMLLYDLHKADLVELTVFSWPSTLGEVYFIKRKLNG